MVKRGEIRGFDVIGEFTSKQAAKTFWVPADTPSTFSRVAKRRQIHVGPLDRTPADAVLAASLGGRPDIAVVIPVAIKDRTIGILYADRLDIKLPPKHRLEKLAFTMAENLSKILRKPRD